ncbi:MAG: TerB family tellurite resistance protein [Kiloniellales bacterium]|nr:TerB family tellurite resistance protein [Kiloniellales bacterium]
MVLELLREGLKKRSARQRDRRFLEATMATSALVAYADGEVSFTERMRLDQILEQLRQLRAFDVHDAINHFNKVIEDLKSEPEEGHARAMDAVEAFAGDAASARLIVRIACHLCVADGVFTEGEQEQVAELCLQLDISPEDCDLDEIIRASREDP